MMRKTGTPRASRLSARIALWTLSLTLLLFVAGCASWSSFGGHRTPLTGRFWNRSDKQDKEQGYDLYAESVAAARPNIAKEAVLAARGSRAHAGEKVSTPPAEDASGSSTGTRLANAEARRTGAVSGSERTRRKTDDTAIRVTLGRPESLPTLADPDADSGAMLASSTKWKRPGESSSRDRPSTPALVSAAPDDRSDRMGSRDGASGRIASEAGAPALASAAPAPAVRQRQAPRSKSSNEQAKDILAGARKKLEAMPTYRVNITRVERVGGKLQPEENVVLSIRRNPRAVRLEWPEGPSKGREVIYSASLDPRTMYVNMANSALPIPRMSIPIDSPMVLRTSRHPITEAGFDTIFDGLEKHSTADAAGIRRDGKLVYKGIERPKGLDEPCHLFERTTPAGETWQVYLDTQTLMPALAVAFEARSGDLIERYAYRDLQPNPSELAAVEAFDPDKRWGESKGLLSRLARAAATASDGNSGRPTTR